MSASSGASKARRATVRVRRSVSLAAPCMLTNSVWRPLASVNISASRSLSIVAVRNWAASATETITDCSGSATPISSPVVPGASRSARIVRSSATLAVWIACRSASAPGGPA